MPRLFSGPALIFIAAVLWGLDGVLRRSLYSLPPATIVFYEHLIGLAVIAPFFLRAWLAETKGKPLTKGEWGAAAAIALFSGVLGTLFFTTALLKMNFIPFSVVFLVQKLQPVFAVFMGWLVLKEKPGAGYMAWAAVALVAGYFVTFPGGVVNFGEGGAYVTAALYALFAAVLWGSTTALSRFLLLRRSNTLVTGLRFLVTTPLALGAVFVLGATPSLSAIVPAQFGTLAVIAVSTGMAALWIYYRGLSTTRVAVSAIVELAFPLTAVAIDFFFYHTTLTAGQYAAAALLLFAMYRVSRAGASQGKMEPLASSY